MKYYTFNDPKEYSNLVHTTSTAIYNKFTLPSIKLMEVNLISIVNTIASTMGIKGNININKYLVANINDKLHRHRLKISSINMYHNATVMRIYD